MFHWVITKLNWNANCIGNGCRGTFTACSALGFIGISQGTLKTGSVFYHHCNAFPTISAAKFTWSSKIEEPKFGPLGRNWGFSVLPSTNNTLSFQMVHYLTFSQLFPWLESALNIFSAWVARKATVPLHRGDKFGLKFLKQGFLPNKLVFMCPIPELKLIGLESVDVVPVDVEINQVEACRCRNRI
jgi:hypothetical protein